MKFMQPLSAAIFFMTNFTVPGGPWPLGSPGSATAFSEGSRIFLRVGGTNSQSGCANQLFCNILPKTARKNLDLRDVRPSTPSPDPPMTDYVSLEQIVAF